MATITGNNVYADPTQWWTLDYTFANSKFTWSVTCHASHTSYWNSIYGLTVNIGGNSYYRGDIDWRNYTPNTIVYNGETNLSDCTISGGQVTLSVSGNFYYGTWNTDYRSYGSGTCAVNPPTVATLTYTATNKYSSMVVAGRSVITFTMNGTSQTGSNTMSYSLYQDGSVISTTTGSSGVNKTVNVTAPSAGSHTYKYTATDGNGTSTTSGNVSITTYAYTPPTFTSVSAVRWSTGNSSGTASDTGTYAKCIGNFTQGKVGTTALTTTLTVTVNNTSSTTTTTGTALYMGGGNLSADNTYTVTFGLKDTYVTTTSVTRTDTLTQGGRGIDLVYGSGHYGVAIGQKATANRFDVNVPTYIQGVPMGNSAVPSDATAFTGGTVTEAVRRRFTGIMGASCQGTIVFCKVATIKINSTYTDTRTTLRMIGRYYYAPVDINIRFQNANSTDPPLQEFSITGHYNNTYIYKSATSTWEVYMSFGQTYGTLCLMEIISAYTTGWGGGITVTPNMEVVGTSVPTGSTRAVYRPLYAESIQLSSTSPYAVMKYDLDNTTGAVGRTSGQTISSQKLSLFGKVCQITLVLNATSGSYSAGSNIFVGSIANYKPTSDVMGVGFYLGGSYVGWIQTSGTITIRATSALSFSGGTATISWTYLW